MTASYYEIGSINELLSTKNPIYQTGIVIQAYEVTVLSSNYNNCFGAEDIEQIDMISYRGLSMPIPKQGAGEVVHRAGNMSLILQGQTLYLGVNNDWS